MNVLRQMVLRRGSWSVYLEFNIKIKIVKKIVLLILTDWWSTTLAMRKSVKGRCRMINLYVIRISPNKVFRTVPLLSNFVPSSYSSTTNELIGDKNDIKWCLVTVSVFVRGSTMAEVGWNKCVEDGKIQNLMWKIIVSLCTVWR